MSGPGPERIRLIRMESPVFASEGLYRQPPFAQSIATVSSAYGIPPLAFQIALSELAVHEGFLNFRSSPHFSKTRRQALTTNSYNLNNVRTNAVLAQKRSEQETGSPTKAIIPHSSIFDRAIMVLLFGRNELETNSPEVFLKRYPPSVRRAGTPLATPSELAALDAKVPADFEGLDLFQGWDEYIASAFPGNFQPSPDSKFRKDGSVANEALTAQFKSYANWAIGHPEGFGLTDDEATTAVITETFGLSAGDPETVERLQQIIGETGKGSLRREYMVRAAVKQVPH